MKKTALLLLLLLQGPFTPAQTTISGKSPRQIGVAIHPNVELLGFVYFLGYEGAQSQTNDYPEKTRKRYAYGIDLYKRYQSFANSRNLSTAIGFAENIWLDYLINLLIQVDNFPDAKLHDRVDITYFKRFSPTGDPAEAKKNATTFLEAMNALFREVDFASYLLQSQKLYAAAVGQVEAGLPEKSFLPAVESFYRNSFDSYQLIPSLTIPAGMGFGASYSSGGKRHAMHVFGAFYAPDRTDSSRIDMGFADKKHLLELSTHEFGHSFVNPVIDQLPQALIDCTERLLSPVEQAMANQGYTTWKACLYEHFVRAGEVVIARNLGRETDAERLRNHYRTDRQFIYLHLIIDELRKYNASKTGTYGEAVRRAMQRLASD